MTHNSRNEVVCALILKKAIYDTCCTFDWIYTDKFVKKFSGGSWAGSRTAHESTHEPTHDFETLNLSMDAGM